MSDDILKTIETLGTRSVSRRSFLRGGAIAAAIAGAVTLAPAVLHGQEQQQDQQTKKDDKKPQGPDQTSSDSSGDSETKTDSQGREYRVCPQCGGNMYRQGRTWTCENCGYSYVE